MPVKIFFCYAHEDEALLNKLKIHLRPLQREGLIDIWDDRAIKAGTEWEREIREQLNTAQLILLLISPDFMNSDYCYSNEMLRAMERHNRGEAKVIPLILRPTHWQQTPFGGLQALPVNVKPVTTWQNEDDAFFNIVAGIKEVVRVPPETLNTLSPAADVPTKPTRSWQWRRLTFFLVIVCLLIVVSSFSIPSFIAQSIHSPTPTTGSPSRATNSPSKTAISPSRTLFPSRLLSQSLGNRQPIYQDSLTNKFNPTTIAAGWGNSLDTNAICNFGSDGLHVISTSGLKACAETTYKYQDVAIIVDMVLKKGHSAGLYCRFSTNALGGTYSGYLIEIDNKGDYNITRGADQFWQGWTFSPLLKKGNGARNTLAIIALDNMLYFYANGKLLVHLADTPPSISDTTTAESSTLTAESSTLAADNATATANETHPPLPGTATADSLQATVDSLQATDDSITATAVRATVVAARGTPLPTTQAGVIAFLAVDTNTAAEAVFSNLKVYSL